MPAQTNSPQPISPPDSARMAEWVRCALEARKGEEVTVLDVRESSTLTDYLVVVSGTSAPHLKALANEAIRALKDEGIACYRQSGRSEDGWIALDYIDVIIHIFRSDLRSYYALEELWAGAAPTA